jgi:hypothetical protein
MTDKVAREKNNLRVKTYRKYLATDGGRLIQVRLKQRDANLLDELKEMFSDFCQSDLICMALKALKECPDDVVIKILLLTEEESLEFIKEKIRKDKRRKLR